MADPKPVSLTQIPQGDYNGPAPEPLAVVGDMPAGSIAAADITDATATGRSVLTATDAAAARAAIGAGTSNLVLGTTASTAKAGDYTPPNASASTKGLVNQGAAVADLAGNADAATIVATVNALLASLRTAGVLAP